MGSGPGRIERAIEAALAAEPDNAFNTEDLCDRAYPGVNRVNKKHRVAVLRALKRVLARRGPTLKHGVAKGLADRWSFSIATTSCPTLWRD